MKKWWPVSESNQGHSDFQSLALPTELTGHVLRREFYSFVSKKELICHFFNFPVSIEHKTTSIIYQKMFF